MKARSAPEALGARTDLAGFGWAPAWVEAPLSPSADDRPACVLVFDDRRIGSAVCERLRRRGHHVVRAIAGDSFEENAGEFVLPPAPDAYHRLVRTLVRIGKTPARVVHLWLAGTSCGAFADHEAGFESVSHLCEALGARSIAADIAVFTSGTLQVADEPVPCASKATVLGPIRGAPHGLSLRLVDLEAEPATTPRLRERIERAIVDRIAPRAPSGDETAELVAEEIAAGAGSGVFAYRGGKRYAERYERLQLEEAPLDELGLREGGTYVVAGGLGTFGLAAAELFAEHARANLVLVDRDSLDGADVRVGSRARAIERMKEHGADVLVLRADVADVEQIAGAVQLARERFGSIHGLVHAAAGAIARAATPEALEDALVPKVQGTMALDRALGDEPLDFFVLCSSVATVVGPLGTAAEIAGNAFVEAYARSRSGHNTHTVAIAWPYGPRGIGAPEAAAALARVLAGERRPVVAVSPIDLAAWEVELRRAPRPRSAPPAPREEPSEPFRHLVPLAAGVEPPLFFASFDGLALLRPLARALRRRVYAARARGRFDSIDALARAYADEIALAHPDGPYLLAAANEAGALAFETGKQLRARGADVALLAMLDARAPVQRDVRGRIDFHLERMKKRGVRHAVEWARTRVEREAGRVRAFLDDDVAAMARRALDRYEWTKEPGRIAFFGVARDASPPGWDEWVDAVDAVELRAGADGIASPLTARVLARRLEDAIGRALE